MPTRSACLLLALLAVLRRAQTEPDMWEPLNAQVEKAAKFELPAGLLEQPFLIETMWFVTMIALVAKLNPLTTP